MKISKKTAGYVKVPIHYLAFDENWEPIINDGVQEENVYTVKMRRRTTEKVKERKFHEKMEKDTADSLSDFCELVLAVEGFEDFPEHDEATAGDLAFDYFNDPDMVDYVIQFMSGYQRRVMPAHFFRNFSPSRVEVLTSQQEGQ